MKNIFKNSVFSLLLSLLVYQTAYAKNDVRFVTCYDNNDNPKWQGQYYILSDPGATQTVMQIVEHIVNGKCVLGPVVALAPEECHGLGINVYIGAQPCTP